MLKDYSKLRKHLFNNRYSIYIPSNIIMDSQFPINIEDNVVVEIVGNTLVIKNKDRDSDTSS